VPRDPEIIKLRSLVLAMQSDDQQTDSEIMLSLQVAAAESPQETVRRLMPFLSRWDGQDRNYLECARIAAGDHRGALARAVASSSILLINQLRLNQALDPQLTISSITDILTNRSISPSLMPTLIEILGRTMDSDAGRVMLKAIVDPKLPPEARARGIRLLRVNIGEFWKDLRHTEELKQTILVALEEPATFDDAMRLAVNVKPPGVEKRLIKAFEAAADDSSRVNVIQAMARFDAPQVRKHLLSQTQTDSDLLRRAAVAALLQLRAFKEFEAFFADASVNEVVRAEAAAAVAGSSGGAVFLLMMMQNEKLSPPLQAKVLPIAARHPDINVRLLFAPFLKDQPAAPTIATLDPKKVLALKGDGDHGHALLAHSAANCMNCHRVGSEGRDVGPELSLIGRKYAPEALLDQIMRPAAAVAHDYVPHVVETQDKGYVVGFIRRDDERGIEMKNDQGAIVEFPRDQIVDVRKQQGTLMPELLLSSFSEQDVADLVAYLSSLKSAPVPVTEWMAVGPFPNDSDKGFDISYPPEKKVDINAEYEGKNGQTVTWQRVKTETLHGRHYTSADKLFRPGTAYFVAYFCTFLDSPQSQEVSMSLGSDDGVKVFVNGKQVYANHRHGAAAPGQMRAQAMLDSGRNVLLVKLEQGEGSAGLYFEIAAEHPVTFQSHP
jgi:putative heme-binding domain-containing protein